MIDSYLLGSLVNFYITRNPSSANYFIVSDEVCGLKQLYRVYDKVKSLPLTSSHPPSRMIYGSVNSFKCFLCKELAELDRFPFLGYHENCAYLSGFVDSNGKVETKDDVKLILYSDCSDMLHRILRFVQIPATLGSRTLTFHSTNVIDLMAKLLPDSRIREQLKSAILCESKCLVVKKDPLAVFPKKAHFSDVGYDVSIIRFHKQLNSKTSLYDTGIALEIPFGFYVDLVPRSSLSKSGWMLANSVGIIDRSYKGNLYVALTKIAEDAVDFVYPFRCCQLIFRRQEFVELELSEQSGDTTTRAEDGFGSSGL